MGDSLPIRRDRGVRRRKPYTNATTFARAAEEGVVGPNNAGITAFLADTVMEKCLQLARAGLDRLNSGTRP